MEKYFERKEKKKGTRKKAYRRTEKGWRRVVLKIDNNYYDKYHSSGAGRSEFVGEKRIPLNSLNKAIFVQKYLKGKILDVGCGSGFDANYFYSRGYDIEGVDISEIAIKNAKKKFSVINFYVHNFEMAEFDKKYDTICCFEVIEHVFDYSAFLKNIRASLEDEGTLIISTPNIFGLKSYIRLMLKDGSVFGVGTSDESHVRFFSIGTLKKILIRNGFEIKKIKTFSSHRMSLPVGWGGNILVVAKKLSEKQ